MKRFFGILVLALGLVAGAAHAADENAAAVRGMLELKQATEALSTNMQQQLDAVKQCNGQGLYWTPTGCQEVLHLNISTVVEDKSVVIGKCNDGCQGNGHKGTTCNVYNIYNCPSGMTPETSLVEVTGEGSSKIMTIRTCRYYKSFTGHNKDRNNGSCPI